MKNPSIALLLFGIVVITGCERRPDGILDGKKMEDVVVDMHMAESVMDQYPGKFRSPQEKQTVINGVFKKNDISKAAFDSSMIWYGAHLNQYMKIYDRVIGRLTTDSKYYSSLLVEAEKKEQTLSGDSVDIWRKSPTIVLNPLLLATNPSNLVINKLFSCVKNFKKYGELLS